MKVAIAFTCAALAVVPITAVAAPAESLPAVRPQVLRSVAGVAVPYLQHRSHRVGKIGFTVGNWGFIGSQDRAIRDPCTGLPAPSFEYPRYSGVEYLFKSALWIGAVKGRDTLVSVGWDGWYAINELFPKPHPEGAIRERTTRAVLREPMRSSCPDVYFSEDAVSEHDLVAVYHDTLISTAFVYADPLDGRQHIPLNLEITQESYAWSYDYADDFIILNWRIKNIGAQPLAALRVGFFVDPDIGHYFTGDYAQDDICGFLHTAPSARGLPFEDTLNMAWAADNDGDPTARQFIDGAATGILGVRMLNTPRPDLQLAFNWWTSNIHALSDWGPRKEHPQGIFIPEHVYLGTPHGDIAKYQRMGNGEIDYDQLEAAIDHQADGWLPPVFNPALAADIASGLDTRFLFSVGDLELEPNATLPLTVAFIAGPRFHTNPAAFQAYFDASRPEYFRAHLDFKPLLYNSAWAERVYDNPGVDTDGDGTRGEFILVDGDTLFYKGDGVPDFKGPPPPPVPEVRFATSRGRVVVSWNGKESETARDLFTNLKDFEGYRVYISRTRQPQDLALVAQRDRVDYLRYRFRPGAEDWIVEDPPFMVDSLRIIYGTLADSLGYAFHPDSFTVASLERALLWVTLDERDPANLDSSYYYFAPFDFNQCVDDLAVYRADSLGFDVDGMIRKVHPYAQPGEIAYRDDGTPFEPYYEYEYALGGIFVAEPVFVAVTAFDFGAPWEGVGSLETQPFAHAHEVWPIEAETYGAETRPKPGVYPNPYRLFDDYAGRGLENPDGLEPDPERARKVTFTNIPDTCTITIWSLDGDLVKRLEHAEATGSARASFCIWDLITRNTQTMRTGIYIYAIESRFGTDLGKLVVIR